MALYNVEWTSVHVIDHIVYYDIVLLENRQQKPDNKELCRTENTYTKTRNTTSMSFTTPRKKQNNQF